jgi:hypothetical protein
MQQRRVAEGRSRLARLILVALIDKGMEANKFACRGAVGEELGRCIHFGVRTYTSLSSIAVAFSVRDIIRSELFLKVTKQNMGVALRVQL